MLDMKLDCEVDDSHNNDEKRQKKRHDVKQIQNKMIVVFNHNSCV